MSRLSTSAISEETRVSSYYGVFFFTVGSVMPFVAIWLDGLGISTTMIGAILAAPPLSIVFFNVIIGSWADRLSDWRSAIIVCNVLVLILITGLLFWQDQWSILVLWTLSGLFMIASTPITDAAVLNLTQRRGSDYAKIRAFGSIGFVIGVVISGKLFDSLGMGLFVWILVLGAIARVTAAIALPKFRDRFTKSIATSPATNTEDQSDYIATATSAKKPKRFNSITAGMALFHQPGIFSVIFGAALLNASHSFNNVYAVLHWTQTGISTSMASVLWTIAVIAEVALMWGFSRIAKRIPARQCLLAASAICTIRWFFTGIEPSIGMLMVLQSLHAITFGLTFLASINFIARRVDPNHAAQAQSVLATLTTLLMAIGTWVAGQFYESLGGYSYWAMAAMAILGGAFILNSYRTKLEDLAL